VGGKQSVRLLYGDEKYPVYDPKTDTWNDKPNLLGQKPKFGKAGYDNFTNFYNWTWTKNQNKLYLGTFDGSTPGGYMDGEIQQVMKFTDSQMKIVNALLKFSNSARKTQGGDLLRMDSLNRPATLETVDGYGDKYEYGTRSFFSFDDHFYAGTGTAWQLVPHGGFSIVKLTPQASPVGPVIRPKPLARVLSVAVRVFRTGIGALPAQAGTATVPAGAQVDLRATVTNKGPLRATAARACVRLPRGFSFGSNPKATITGRQACTPVAGVPAKGGTRTVVVHAVASDRPETAVAVAHASGSEIGISDCGEAAIVPIAEPASARASQVGADAPDCPPVTSAFRVRALPDAARVRVIAPGGVTG
jgi:hypothetical protein